MEKELIFELLSSVHKYYPIGVPQLFQDYPGYTAIKKKIEEKLTTEEYRLWKKLGSDVKLKFSSYNVVDLS